MANSLDNFLDRYNLTRERFRFTPKMFGWIMLVIFVIIIFWSYPFLHRVFSGEWILDQNIFRVRIDYLNLFGWEFPIKDITIRFYSFFFLLAILVGYAVTYFFINRSALPNPILDRLFIGIILYGMIGSRLFFVLFNLDQFVQDPMGIIMINQGGLSIFGGVIGAVFYIWMYTRKYRFNILEILDVLVPGLLFGQIIGRIGNFFNYEAYGAPTAVAWKMYVPEQAINSNRYIYDDTFSKFFHPTWLYEVVLNSILLVLILINYDKLSKKFVGRVVAAYLIGYGAIRFFTEFFRLDALKIPINLSLYLPSWLAKLIGLFIPGSLKEPTVYWLEHMHFDAILASQVVALGFFVCGIWLYIRRSRILYSYNESRELN